MKNWILYILSFLLGGIFVGAISLKFLFASWQSAVLVQNDIYALNLDYVSNQQTEILVTRSCAALRSGL